MSWAHRLELGVGAAQLRTLQAGLAAAAGLRRRTLAADGLTLAAYQRPGAGTPVVLIHGFGGDKETWLLMAPWLRRRPLLVIDLPGHGESTAIDRHRANPEAMGRAIAAALDAAGIARAHLCGNSMGGGIALWMARHLPARVASLALVASVAPELAESELTRALARGENLLIPGAAAGADGADADRFVALVTEKPPKVPRAVRRYVAARRAGARVQLEEMFRGWVEATPERGLPRDLHAITHPTLVIHGRCDRIIAVDTARKVVAALPHSALRILDGIGHVPQLEAPRRVAALLRDHLDRVPA